MVKFATNLSGAILLPSSIQVMESISGSVVPLAMFLSFIEISESDNLIEMDLWLSLRLSLTIKAHARLTTSQLRNSSLS